MKPVGAGQDLGARLSAAGAGTGGLGLGGGGGGLGWSLGSSFAKYVGGLRKGGLDVAIVAGGISEALIATALGLAVGILAVVLYNYFQARVERIDAALQIGSARLIEALEAGRRRDGVR